jgi:hypothetical protein
MKLAIFAGGALACVALSGCGTISAANQDAMAQAIAAKIPYCSGDLQIDAGIGGIAGTGTGIKNSGQLHCPGKPYDAGPAVVTAPTAPVVP